MINQKMTQKLIAEQIGVSNSYISKIFSGDKFPSPHIAKKLEAVTGIDRLAWLYPGEYENPYVETKEVSDDSVG